LLSIRDRQIGDKSQNRVEEQSMPSLVDRKLIEIEDHELFVLLFQILLIIYPTMRRPEGGRAISENLSNEEMNKPLMIVFFWSRSVPVNVIVLQIVKSYLYRNQIEQLIQQMTHH
jgi:hypothetical protein